MTAWGVALLGGYVALGLSPLPKAAAIRLALLATVPVVLYAGIRYGVLR
jgi:hypothetical protein